MIIGGSPRRRPCSSGTVREGLPRHDPHVRGEGVRAREVRREPVLGGARDVHQRVRADLRAVRRRLRERPGGVAVRPADDERVHETRRLPARVRRAVLAEGLGGVDRGERGRRVRPGVPAVDRGANDGSGRRSGGAEERRMTPTWDILICSIPHRDEMLADLLAELDRQHQPGVGVIVCRDNLDLPVRRQVPEAPRRVHRRLRVVPRRRRLDRTRLHPA
jgi:hypothetical protein